MVVVCRPPDRPGVDAGGTRRRACTGTCPTSTSTSRPATRRSCRAGSPPRWSWSRLGGRSCPSRWPTTSSSSATCATAWSATGPAVHGLRRERPGGHRRGPGRRRSSTPVDYLAGRHRRRRPRRRADRRPALAGATPVAAASLGRAGSQEARADRDPQRRATVGEIQHRRGVAGRSARRLDRPRRRLVDGLDTGRAPSGHRAAPGRRAPGPRAVHRDHLPGLVRRGDRPRPAGRSVVVDVGHHDGYSRPRHLLPGSPAAWQGCRRGWSASAARST